MSGVTETTPLLAPESKPGLSKARKRLIVFMTLTTSFLCTMDMTIVATCIPTIASELQSFDREAWIGTAYLWSNVSFTPLYGRLSDIIGRRAAYEQGLFLFTLGTALCGFAPNFNTLILARFIAGMGGGGLTTVSAIITADTFAPSERGFYTGIGFAVFGLGIGLGGPIGGWLTQAFGWRAAFYAQLPVAVACMILARITIPTSTNKRSASALKEIDFGGAGSLLVAIGAVLLLLQRSSVDIPFSKDTASILALVFAITFFIVFIYVEIYVAAKPVLPLSLLKRPTCLCVGIISGVIAIVNFNMIYHLPMLFEIVFQENISRAGSHILPNSLAMAISAPIMGLIVKKTHRYKKLITLNCLGPVIAMLLLAHLTPASGWAARWLSVLPMGAGFSGLLTLTLVASLNAVSKSEIATVTGFTFVFRAIGQVFGVGISGAVFQTSLLSALTSRFSSPEIISKLRHASQAIGTLPLPDQILAREAYAVALRNTFIFGLLGAVGVLVVSFFIPDNRIDDDEEDKEGEEDEENR